MGFTELLGSQNTDHKILMPCFPTYKYAVSPECGPLPDLGAPGKQHVLNPPTLPCSRTSRTTKASRPEFPQINPALSFLRTPSWMTRLATCSAETQAPSFSLRRSSRMSVGWRSFHYLLLPVQCALSVRTLSSLSTWYWTEF